jgi:hypothetical protein
MSENNNSIGMNELVDYQKKTYSPFMDRVMKFLWKCGGADAQILQYAPYSDHIKNAGIGGVVLATTVMATLAMGFAMHTIFASPSATKEIDPVTGDIALEGNWFITIPVALIWGLIIFNLDRFIVSTVKGDGTEKITGSEWLSMLPRLFMAILIGLTISAPLETYIFKREINREWNEVKTDLALKARFDMNNEMNNDGDLLSLTKNVASDSTQLAKLTRSHDSLKYFQLNVEHCQRYPCGKHQNSTSQRKFLEDQMEATQNSFMADTSKLRLYKEQRTDTLQKISDSVKRLKPGFLDQIMMLERLSGEGKKITKYDPQTGEKIMKEGKADEEEIYGSAFWPIWLVRLLFMIVEIAPVIFKFMIWKSSYDYMQDNVSQILEAKQGISLELIPDENNNLHKVKENYNARRIVEVAKRQNELEKENAIHAITLYAEKEREEIEKDPERFVQGDSNEGNKG